MTHTVSLHYPPDLYDAPELALLAVLDATLQQTLYALFAAHPELTSGDTLETCWANGPDLWAADAVCNYISTLQHAVERYKQAIEAARHRRHASDDIE